MKESKYELKQAILIVGESLDILEATESLLKSAGIYTTVRELIYIMFVKDRQQYFETDDKVFAAIGLIRAYCKEMVATGEVNFEVPYVHKR
jgi:hypothetical protein